MKNKKTTKGITISVTMPSPLEKSLQKGADSRGISKSRHICNILLDQWQDEDIKKVDEDKKIQKASAPSKCDHRSKDGHCVFFDIDCEANQASAETCEGYYEGKV